MLASFPRLLRLLFDHLQYPKSFCILQVIKNWGRRRPGEDAAYVGQLIGRLVDYNKNFLSPNTFACQQVLIKFCKLILSLCTRYVVAR